MYKLNRQTFRFRPLHERQIGCRLHQRGMNRQRKPDKYLHDRFNLLRSLRLRFRASELGEMIEGNCVTVCRFAFEHRRSPTNKRLARYVRRLSTLSEEFDGYQQSTESSSKQEQSARNGEGFANTARNVKRSLNTEESLTGAHLEKSTIPLLLSGTPRSDMDMQWKADSSKSTTSDTSNWGHQTYYTRVIKHSSQCGKFFDENTPLTIRYIDTNGRNPRQASPIQGGKIIRRRARPTERQL